MRGLPFGVVDLSRRVRALKPSGTLLVTARAKAMKAEGIDVIGFGAGEPDFDTPVHIRNAAKQALDEGWTHYMSVAGDPAAREAIARKLRDEDGLDHIKAANVLITSGGKQAFYLLCSALFDEGGSAEMILPTPGWVSYAPIGHLTGAKIVEIETTLDGGFKMTPQQLADALTPNSRLLVVNSPCNPTGVMYTPGELAALTSVVNEHNRNGGNLIVVSDDIYEKIVYGQTEFATIGRFLQSDYSVTINGLSKSYAMTGWRIGYAAGPTEIIESMIRLQGQMTTCITSFCYRAIAQALKHGDEDAKRMCDEYRMRADVIHTLVRGLPGVRCLRPEGAFYLFPEISSCYGRTSPDGRKIETCIDFAAALLDEAHVAVVPGDEFGGVGINHVRLSFAASIETIERGLERIGEFLAGVR